MKRLILLEVTLLFLATTFSSNPPGWYQQTLPVSGTIHDIFFLDSLKGWVVTNNGYILHTETGGESWDIQIDSAGNLYTVQFSDSVIGYALGNGLHGIIYKTTNGGTNWNLIHDFNPAAIFRDMSFISKDTGWVCSQDPFDGGVFKTTNGGISWIQQWDADHPNRIQFINSDTGWTAAGRNLYRTTNGGTNWNLQYTFPQQINDIQFINPKKGWISSGRNHYTIDGGMSWTMSNEGGVKLAMINENTGWVGNTISNRVYKTTDGGIIWGYQNSPITNNSYVSAVDILRAWSARLGVAHTTDGGGIMVKIGNNIISEIPTTLMLYQNYPNPFNPKTIIKYEILSFSKVTLKIFDIAGKEITELINENQSAGTYQYEFDGSGLSSGVYFYRLEAKSNNNSYIETKKMILAK